MAGSGPIRPAAATGNQTYPAAFTIKASSAATLGHIGHLA
jgi:hypothetical protein